MLTTTLSSGVLEVGTTLDPIPASIRAEIIFVLPQGYVFDGGATPQTQDVGRWAAGGHWETHGAPLTRTWSKLAEDVSAGGDPALLVAGNDLTDWRNGLDGLRWGYHRAPNRVFQVRAIENGDDGIGADPNNGSGTRYVQDAELIRNRVGIKNGHRVVRPIYPDYPYT